METLICKRSSASFLVCLLLLLPVQVVMREGAVLESGSHAQLLQRDGAYAQLVKLQPSL